MNSDNYNRAIILFDEQGTPTFRTDRETDSFIGVAITYNLTDESEIFRQCSDLFGLTNTSPLRNREISNSRVENITNTLIQLPVQIIIASVDLTNSEFQQVVTLYEEYGNLMRERHRNIRERPLSHILHTHILDECIFNSVRNYTERNQTNTNFSILIDNWAIPVNDIDIYLEQRSQSLESKINSLYQEVNLQFRISVPTISPLNEDNSRKRFIGVLASVVSRSFMNTENERYNEYPLNHFTTINHNDYFEITDQTMEFLRDFMDESSRNPPGF